MNTGDADWDDLCLDPFQDCIERGNKEGRETGLRAGFQEGVALGRRKGVEYGVELGYIRGFADEVQSILDGSTGANVGTKNEDVGVSTASVVDGNESANDTILPPTSSSPSMAAAAAAAAWPTPSRLQQHHQPQATPHPPRVIHSIWNATKQEKISRDLRQLHVALDDFESADNLFRSAAGSNNNSLPLHSRDLNKVGDKVGEDSSGQRQSHARTHQHEHDDSEETSFMVVGADETEASAPTSQPPSNAIDVIHKMQRIRARFKLLTVHLGLSRVTLKDVMDQASLHKATGGSVSPTGTHANINAQVLAQTQTSMQNTADGITTNINSRSDQASANGTAPTVADQDW